MSFYSRIIWYITPTTPRETIRITTDMFPLVAMLLDERLSNMTASLRFKETEILR